MNNKDIIFKLALLYLYTVPNSKTITSKNILYIDEDKDESWEPDKNYILKKTFKQETIKNKNNQI